MFSRVSASSALAVSLLALIFRMEKPVMLTPRSQISGTACISSRISAARARLDRIASVSEWELIWLLISTAAILTMRLESLAMGSLLYFLVFRLTVKSIAPAIFL